MLHRKWMWHCLLDYKILKMKIGLANLRQIRDQDVSVHHEVFLSQDAEDMQNGIEESTLDNFWMEDLQKDEIGKEIDKIMEDMFKDTRVSVNDILE